MKFETFSNSDHLTCDHQIKLFFTLTTHYKVSASFCDIKNKTTTHVPLTFKQNKHNTMNIHRGTLFHVRVSILPSVYHEYYALHTAM